MQKKEYSFRIAVLYLALFAVFTVMVRFLDVQPIGPEGSSVGFAGINGLVANLIGRHDIFYSITQGLGYLALLLAMVFAVVGLTQLIRTRSLRSVDYRLLLLGACYVVTIACYLLFDQFAVNYRPIILDPAEGLEPSYPSSHTMLALVVFLTALKQFRWLLKTNTAKAVLGVICLALIAVTIVFRLLSGAHWFTDIVGGVLLSAAIIAFYNAACTAVERARAAKGGPAA